MGFLDAIDSSDMLSTLLGMSPQNAGPGYGGPATSYADPGSGGPADPSAGAQDPAQNYTIDRAPRQGGAPTTARPLGMDQFTQTWGNPMGGAAPPQAAEGPTPGAPPVAPQAPAANPQVSMPMPTQDPRTVNASTRPTLAGPDDPAMVMGPGTTDNSARSMPPAAVPGAPAAPVPPVAPTQGGGLFSQLSGIQPAKPNQIGQALYGLGKGLSAVGGLRPGATVGQAFAAGAGGALQGGYEAGQKEDQDFFKNTISADNQVMKGKKFGHDIAHEDASTNYLNSGVQKNLANAALGPMGKVYGSWLQSDVGRLKLADTAFDNQEKRNVQYLQEKNKAGIDVTKDWQKMEEGREARKAAVYKQYGITDPSNYKGSQKNPIDASTMTPKQIEQAPEGTYFKYTGKDGKTVIAPRDYNVHPNRAALPEQGGTSDYAATQAALAGGGAQ